MKQNNSVFIVEDDPWYADLLEYNIRLDPELSVEKYASGKDCLSNLYKRPMAITLDYSLPDMKGKDVLASIKKSHPDIPVIIISGQEDIKTALLLLKEGAYDYIVKDDDTRNRLFNTLRNISEIYKLRKENQSLKEQVSQHYSFSNMLLGSSQVHLDVLHKIEKASNSNVTVAITGETGTGKELVAKAIHYNSDRKSKSLVAINVSAIPSELIESELFGHEKGAFTGAINRRIGKFEEANQGTLFLDEIGEMDLTMQAKLLRVLQERELTRIGGTSPIKIDVKLITATHKDLSAEVEKGNFRADLFYRVMGLPIHLPPLRERGSDILLLAKHFADEYCKENKKPKITFSPEAKTKLLKYSYPGNVRELKSAIELAVVMSDGNSVEADDINFYALSDSKNLLMNEMSLDDYTREIIRHYLKKYNQKVIPVAAKLKIAKSTLYRLMKKYNLE